MNSEDEQVNESQNSSETEQIDETQETQQTNQIINVNDNSNIELDDNIHMYKQTRGRKCNTIISGLKLNDKAEIKNFISKIKKKYGAGGCHKMVPEINKINLVFVFTGDLREKIKKILIDEYQKSELSIEIHS